MVKSGQWHTDAEVDGECGWEEGRGEGRSSGRASGTLTRTLLKWAAVMLFVRHTHIKGQASVQIVRCAISLGEPVTLLQGCQTKETRLFGCAGA